MKRQAQAERVSPVRPVSSTNYVSGEYLQAERRRWSSLTTPAVSESKDPEAARLREHIEALELMLEERASELFLAREKLRMTSSFLPQTHEPLEGAVFVVTRDGAIDSVNDAALEFLGYGVNELIGQKLDKILDASRGTPLTEAQVLSPEGTALRSEQLCVAKSGLRIPVLFSISALGVLDSAGEPRKFVCVAFDLAARKEQELEVRQAQKLEAVGRLSAGVVHEIHAPIQFVADGVHFLSGATQDLMGLLQTHREAMCAILEGGPVTKLAARTAKAEATADLDYLLENVPRTFENCREGLKRVSTIVRSMKEFSHPDPRERSFVDLNAQVQSTLAIAVNEYKYVADLTTDLGVLPDVLCFASDINRVVLNLVVNAAHAVADAVQGTGKRGRIDVRTRLDGDDVVISVADTGAGIPEPIRERVFEPFFTTKAVGRGTGQGLAIARSVVAGKHRGKIWFESVVGQGTTFFVRLPVRGAECDPSSLGDTR